MAMQQKQDLQNKLLIQMSKILPLEQMGML